MVFIYLWGRWVQNVLENKLSPFITFLEKERKTKIKSIPLESSVASSDGDGSI